MKSPDEIKASGILDEYWYYAIELAPGFYTPGKMHQNVALTRLLASRCAVEGLRCLDIGAMEAALPLLFTRRNAAAVSAVDMLDFTRKVELIKENTGAQFDYHTGVRLERLPEFFAERGEAGFDVVLCSGVLYHVFNPMRTLGVARSLMRPGGILLLETAAVLEDTTAMYYNNAGSIYYDWTSFWFITVPCLDAMLRYFQLAVLDCAYLPPSELAGRQVARVAVACRAVDEVLPLHFDKWMQDAKQTIDYSGDIRWDLCSRPAGKEPVPYDVPPGLFYHQGVPSVDLLGTCWTTMPLAAEDDRIRVSLSDLV
jgi:SAM-dependent methyltransferase